jgi:hypothetical protein
MNSDTNNINRASGAAVGFIAACLIFIALAVIVKFSVSVPAVDADRDAVRAKALAEIRAAEDKSLNTAGWVDPTRGIVRLPIDTAMQITAQQWRNPAQARADLLSRQENAAKPAKPVSFE